jgi:hypothetical protein
MEKTQQHSSMGSLMNLFPSDLKKYTILDGDYTPSRHFEDLIIEYDGCFKSEDESVLLLCEGIEVQVTYCILVLGHNYYDPGDWDQAPYNHTEIDDVEIVIVSISVEDDVMYPTEKLNKHFIKVIKHVI